MEGDKTMEEFYEEKKEKDIEINTQLDQLSKGLADLQRIAGDINVTLEISHDQIEENTRKMDETTDQIIGTNKSLKKLFVDSKYPWRCIVFLMVLLAGILAYVLTILPN
jgi:hypothetical protein